MSRSVPNTGNTSHLTSTVSGEAEDSMQSPEKHEKHENIYESYLEQDWKQGRAHIPLPAFCAHLLRISVTGQPHGVDFTKADPDLAGQYSSDFAQYAPRANTRVAEAIINSQEYQEKKQAYINAKGKARYIPFCDIVNYVIEVFAREAESTKNKGSQTNAVEIVLVRNDPKCIEGSIGARSPDVIAIRKVDRFVKGEEGQVPVDRAQNWKVRGMNSSGFYWSELLFFVEFEAELGQNEETRPGSNPSGQRVTFDSDGHFVKTYVANMGSNSSPNNPKKRRAEEEADSLGAYGPGVKKSRLEQSLDSKTEDPDSNEAEGGEIPEPDYFKTGVGYHVKCAGYALEMFTSGGFRTFVLGFLLKGNRLQLCSYQRSRIILSHSFNFLEDDHSFLAIIEGLVRCDHERKLGIWIRPSKMTQSSNSSVGDVFPFYPQEPSNRLDIKSTQLLHIQRALICRGTHVLRGEAPVDTCPTRWFEALGGVDAGPKNKLEVVLKASSVSRSRAEECAFIDKAVTQAKDSTSSAWALLRLPIVLHSETSRDADENELRSAFALKNEGLSYEIRELRILVLAPLFPVTQATSGYELLRLYIDYVQVHKFLVQCGILHRDISLNNLMYRIRYVNGIERKYGVMNDFDLAMEFERNSGMHKQQTGTRPYMAYELLHPSPPRHYPRHDLESIYYSMLIHVFHWHEGKPAEELPYQEWFDGTCEEVRLQKLVFLSRKGRYRIGIPTPNFGEVFRSVLIDLHNLFKSAIGALRDHLDERIVPSESQAEVSSAVRKEPVPAPFNLKTLDSRITHDTVLLPLQSALEKYKPWALRENLYVEEPSQVKFNDDRSYEDEDKDNEELLDYLAYHFR